VCCQEKRDPGYSIRIEQAYQPEHWLINHIDQYASTEYGSNNTIYT
jgi:hypothetical protein